MLAVTILALFTTQLLADPVRKVIYVTKTGNITSNPTPDTAARVEFKDLIEKTGWSFLRVTTNYNMQDEDQAHAAGLGEGYLTAARILDTWTNTMSGYCNKSSDYCSKLKKYMVDNQEWMRSMIRDNKDTSSYWYQINLVLKQLEGLHEGFDRVYPGVLTLHDIYLLNFNLDLIDMEDALGTDEVGFSRNKYGLGRREEVTREKERMLEKVLGSGHCTALVRWTGEDLFVSHVTWNNYASMVRVVKRYEFFYKEGPGSSEVMVGSTQVFTSYPGYLFSGDDYTLISSGLAAQETTIANLNSDLWKYVHPENSVPEYIRSIVANRLASGGESWCEIFKKFNSGTYNNQWMIVDYNLFTPNSPELKPGTLFVLEQLPGNIVFSDRTSVLQRQQYWPSYNLPYYPDIFKLSGIQVFVDKFGDIFSYGNNPRAKIFKRDAQKVVDMDTLYKLMRYNDYKEDPLSRCECSPPYSAINAISSRSDLNPLNGTYPLPLFGAQPSGGIDYKGTNYSLMKKLEMRIAGGPTWEDQPPFRWSTSSWSDVPHRGMSDLQQFEEMFVTFDGEIDL